MKNGDKTMANNAKNIVIEFLTYLIESESIDEKIIASYLHDDFIQYVDGKTLNKLDCISHAKAVKSSVHSGKVTFEHIISESNKVCTVHLAQGKTNEGNYVKFKVIAYFEIKDNKVWLFDELTRMVSGNDSDSDITSRS